MRVRNIVAEDFANYRLPSMFIISCFCDFKCCHEQNLDTGECQNAPLVQGQIKDISNDKIYSMFVNNPITKAIVIGGLEPILQIDEIITLIDLFRKQGEKSPFIIYTGYYSHEIKDELYKLKQYENIIIKFGRYIPNHNPHYDEVLGINLVSDNQYGEVIS